MPEINVNIQNNDDRTALILAAMSGHVDLVRKLLRMDGIELSVQDVYGNTALMFAAEKGYLCVVQLLVRRLAAAEVNLLDNNQRNACARSAEAAAKYLIYSGKVLSGGDYDLDIKRLQYLAESVASHNRFRGGYGFLIALRDKMLLLSSTVAENAMVTLPCRVALLSARLCGVVFPEDITVKYAAMRMQEFKVVSSIMRSAVLAKVINGLNSYMFVYMLMRENVESMFLCLSDDLRNYLLGFLVEGDDVGFAAKDIMALRNTVVMPASVQEARGAESVKVARR